ncbi:PP2C family protein-serine/threonine phosphatase [Dethiothermospora halolimnae]|uniref:PP2C family protein-serine/threonine phosphatase n=1 Tax=Dethiothermospora halolimnae TaxID=3114390 RepID=UPI003CCC0A71
MIKTIDKNLKRNSLIIDKNYIYIILTMIFCVSVITILNLTEEVTYKIVETDTYLMMHILLEFICALIGFASFSAIYFTFDLFKKLRTVILGQTLFVVSFIDIFHILSYKGMPAVFTENTAQKATAYWIVGRLFMAIGLFLFSIISEYRKTKLKKIIFLVFGILSVGLMFYIVSIKGDILPTLFIEGKGLTAYKIGAEYIIIAIQVISVIILLREYLKSKNDLTIGIIIALIFSISSEITFTLYSSVYDTYNLLGHVFKIFAYFTIFIMVFLDTVRRPYIRLADMQGKLKHYADNLEVAVTSKTEEIRNKNRNLMRINEKMIEDLEAAKEIQQSLLPSKYKKYGNVTFNSKYIPCQRLSGDFYNYFKIDRDNIGFYVIDVSGHGVSAAMVTVFASRSLDVQTIESDGDYSLLNPKEVLLNFYNNFNNSSFPDETHLVMIYGVYNIKTGEMKFSSAGHNCPPVLVSQNKRARKLDYISGFPICKLGDLFEPEYAEYTINLEKGEKVIFYTDGIPELKNDEDQFYSVERLRRLVNHNKLRESNELIDIITNDLNNHKSLSDIEDDITFFIMEVS